MPQLAWRRTPTSEWPPCSLCADSYVRDALAALAVLAAALAADTLGPVGGETPGLLLPPVLASIRKLLAHRDALTAAWPGALHPFNVPDCVRRLDIEVFVAPLVYCDAGAAAVQALCDAEPAAMPRRDGVTLTPCDAELPRPRSDDVGDEARETVVLTQCGEGHSLLVHWFKNPFPQLLPKMFSRKMNDALRTANFASCSTIAAAHSDRLACATHFRCTGPMFTLDDEQRGIVDCYVKAAIMDHMLQRGMPTDAAARWLIDQLSAFSAPMVIRSPTRLAEPRGSGLDSPANSNSSLQPPARIVASIRSPRPSRPKTCRGSTLASASSPALVMSHRPSFGASLAALHWTQSSATALAPGTPASLGSSTSPSALGAWPRAAFLSPPRRVSTSSAALLHAPQSSSTALAPGAPAPQSSSTALAPGTPASVRSSVVGSMSSPALADLRLPPPETSTGAVELHMLPRQTSSLVTLSLGSPVDADSPTFACALAVFRSPMTTASTSTPGSSASVPLWTAFSPVSTPPDRPP